MNRTIAEKLKETAIEDIIWLVYLFIIERDYIKNHNLRSRDLFRQINKYVLIIAFFIYLYFVYQSYGSVRNLKANASDKKVFLTNLTLITAVLFLIAGGINIFIQNNSVFDDEIGLV